MKRRVGLYLGTSSVGISVTQGKEIEFLGRYGFSSLDESKIDTLNEDIRWEALINKALREAGIDGGEAYVSLSDKDFIVRSLEMPLLKRNEIESSLVYEIEKYIPFKVSELEWAYEHVRFAKEKRMNISFIGIKESNLARIREILSRLNITMIISEPSCLSLERTMKASRELSKLRDFAFLDLTQSESYLTFFQHGLPVFNRYLVVPKKEEALDVNKFIESVDFSFQYFKREYKDYKLEKFIIVGEAVDASMASSLQESLQAEVVTVSPYDLTARENASVESLKALGAASRDYYPSTFTPVFKKPEFEPEAGMEIAEVPVEIPMLRLGLMAFLVGAGLVTSFFVAVVMGNDVTYKKEKLEQEEDSLIVPEAMSKLSWKEREALVAKKRQQVEILREINDSFIGFSGFINKLHRKGTLPDGVWLDKLSVRLTGKGYTGTLKGYIFRDDDYKERLGLDELVASLKSDESVMSVFSDVELDQSRRQSMREFEVTYFIITLR
jgi:hypothetical protein